MFKFLHNMTYSTCTLYTSYNDSCSQNKAAYTILYVK